MANEEQLAILRQGVEVWNRWREENPNVVVDLSWADLQEIKLGDIRDINFLAHRLNFERADLNHADLKGADISQANLREANLTGADLRFAKFQFTNFSNAILASANLDGANLIHSYLTWTNCSETVFGSANLSFASFGHTILTFTSLMDVIGLDSISHYSPSDIGMDSIRNFSGKVPEKFLRGCGLSDLDIEYAKLAAPDLRPEQITDITYKIHDLYAGKGVQYYSCFISYNSKDEEFPKKLHDNLQNNGVRCWFAPEDMKIGDQIRPRIDQEIRLRDKLLVILSENSVNSEWVGDEVEAALEEESKSNRLILFPIRMDDAVMSARDDWAAKIKRRRHIGDFSNWKDKANYQKAFERLLRDLKATK